MLSKNDEDLKALDFIFDKEKGEVFLDETEDLEALGEKICYMTYPRVGNTFLRKMLQVITGIQTGSDMQQF